MVFLSLHFLLQSPIKHLFLNWFVPCSFPERESDILLCSPDIKSWCITALRLFKNDLRQLFPPPQEFLGLLLVPDSIGRTVFDAYGVPVAQIALDYVALEREYGAERTCGHAHPAADTFLFVDLYNTGLVPGNGIFNTNCHARRVIALNTNNGHFISVELVSDDIYRTSFRIAFAELVQGA